MVREAMTAATLANYSLMFLYAATFLFAIGCGLGVIAYFVR